MLVLTGGPHPLRHSLHRSERFGYNRARPAHLKSLTDRPRIETPGHARGAAMPTSFPRPRRAARRAMRRGSPSAWRPALELLEHRTVLDAALPDIALMSA